MQKIGGVRKMDEYVGIMPVLTADGMTRMEVYRTGRRLYAFPDGIGGIREDVVSVNNGNTERYQLSGLSKTTIDLTA